MPTSKKIFTVQNFAEKLKQAKGLVLADYQGLNVAQMAKLRREVKKAGGEFEVVKNSLLQLALENVKSQMSPKPFGSGQADFKLKEPTAALWIYEEDTAPLRALYLSIKKTDLPKVKSGLWDGELISVEKILKLATLPGPDELRVKLIGTLQSPVSGLTNALGWNMRKLTYILNAKIKEQESKRARN